MQYSQDQTAYFVLQRKPSEINTPNKKKWTPSPTTTYQQPYHNNITFAPGPYNHTIQIEQNIELYYQFETF